jgi:hypothetical protein
VRTVKRVLVVRRVSRSGDRKKRALLTAEHGAQRLAWPKPMKTRTRKTGNV